MAKSKMVKKVTKNFEEMDMKADKALMAKMMKEDEKHDKKLIQKAMKTAKLKKAKK